MNDKDIADIINRYDAASIPDSLREVCQDYFCSGANSVFRDLESSDSDEESLATCLPESSDLSLNNEVSEFNIEDIPIFFQVR